MNTHYDTETTKSQSSQTPSFFWPLIIHITISSSNWKRIYCIHLFLAATSTLFSSGIHSSWYCSYKLHQYFFSIRQSSAATFIIFFLGNYIKITYVNELQNLVVLSTIYRDKISCSSIVTTVKYFSKLFHQQQYFLSSYSSRIPISSVATSIIFDLRNYSNNIFFVFNVSIYRIKYFLNNLQEQNLVFLNSDSRKLFSIIFQQPKYVLNQLWQ